MIDEGKVEKSQSTPGNGSKSSASSAKSRVSACSSLSSSTSYSATSSTTTKSSSSSSTSSSSSSSSHKTHKIEAKKARSRNFIFGAIGHEGSLLGEDELKNVLPESKISIHLVTWNMANRAGPDNWNEILLPTGNDYLAEIYAIGTQETCYTATIGSKPGNQRDLTVNLQATLGPSHVLLHSISLGVLSLFIFIRRDLIWYVSLPEDCVFNSRPKATNLVKTKGALAISFTLFGTSLLFINCHLPAHANRNQDRIDDYVKICRSIDLPRNLRPLKPSYQSADVTSRFDTVFWLGDLNFRIEQKYTDALRMLTKASLTSFEILLHDDQLRKALNKGDIFHGFNEASTIDFAPTYKYRIGSDGFDLLSERVPSYTDRILYRTKGKDQVHCLTYDCITSIKSSDHKPVYALMEVQVKPGRDDAPLNAGLFNREIYLEGLKKRGSEHPIVDHSHSHFEPEDEDDDQIGRRKAKVKQSVNDESTKPVDDIEDIPSAVCSLT